MKTFVRVLAALSLVQAGVASESRASALGWNNLAGGSAATAANWAPAQVPVAADDLTFNIGGAYTVTWNATVPNSHMHIYRSGTVTNNVSSPHAVSTGITVGDLAADVATMTLTTGTLTSNASMVVGDAATSSGTLNVNDDDADLIIAGATSDLTIGLNGDATLSITGSGRVEVADQFIAGSNSASTPTVTVSGFALFLGSSTLDVLGTSQSRIGAGGDATMTVSNGALAAFAGDLVIANGSASNSSLTVETAALINATLQVDGDLLVGRNSSAGIAAGTGTLEINTGGTATVGGDTLVGDPDGGSGTILLGGGTFTGALPVQLLSLSSIFGTGTVNADVTVGPGSIVATTATGLTLNGIVNCTTAGVSGTKIHFGPTGGYSGSGSCATEITGDPAAVITATGTLTLGKSVVNGVNYDGILDVGTQDVTLTDSNGALMGGLTTLSTGGNLIVPSGLGLELSGRIQGDGGTITANVTNAGTLDPQRSPTPGGIMSVQGNLLMNSIGDYDMEIGGPPASNQHDRVNVTGTATFGGTIRVSLPTGYVPHVGEQFIAINATAGRTGEFASIIPPSPPPCNDVTFVMVYSSTVAIVLIRPPLGCTALGDLDSNGGCDGTDIPLFLDALINGPYDNCADMNGNCVNDVLDVPIFVNCLVN